LNVQEQDPRSADLTAEEDVDAGRTALRVRRGAPPVVTVLLAILIVVAIAAVIWAILDPGGGWAVWVVVAGFVIAFAGLAIAANPRRRSPAGGTEEH